MLNKTCLLLLSLWVWLATPSQVSAQTNAAQPMNLSLSPVTLSLETTPGQAVTTSLKIRNNSSQTENLTVSVGSFTADESGENPILLEQQGEEFLSWLSIVPNSFSVDPGEWKTLDVQFSPPETAALSYYYTILISRAEQPLVSGETVVQGSPAVLVLTTVQSPNAVRQLEVVSFTPRRNLSEYLPLSFDVTIRNSGNVHVVPLGNIFIDGQGKKDLAVLSLNPALSSILPQTERTFQVEWGEGFPVSQPTSESEYQGAEFMGLYWDFSQAHLFRLGPYKAHLLMAYDSGERDVPIESSIHFWILPWKLLLMGGVFLIFAAMGIRSTVKSIWQKIRSLLHSVTGQ